MRRNGFTLIELMIVVVVVGILAAIVIPNFVAMRDRLAREDVVRANCHAVQLAAEDFYVRNDGVYPKSLSDRLPNGQTIIDLLPGGQRLNNPFTERPTEPTSGVATEPGQCCYSGVDADEDGVCDDGYAITAFGRDGLIMTLTSGD